MKETFDTALAAVLRHEGGYVDHPRDPGGATNRGVTLATLSGVLGRPATKAELQALTQADTAPIYRTRYWDAVCGDDLPAGLDCAVFDLAVHSGPRRAVLMLQKALGVTEDGRVGPATLDAARRADAATIIAALTRDRQSFLRGLSTFTTFGRGWQRRVSEVETHALTLVAKTSAIAAPTVPSVSPTKPLSTMPSPTKSLPSKEFAMTGLKSILGSRTVLSNVIGLAALGLSAFGFSTAGLDTAGLTDAILQGVAAFGFISSTIFRVMATKKLVP